MRDKKLVRAVLLITVVVTSLFLNVKLNFAQETKAPEPPKAEAPAAPGAPAAATPAPKLPPYFTATSPDPKTPLWPDTTGWRTTCFRSISFGHWSPAS